MSSGVFTLNASSTGSQFQLPVTSGEGINENSQVVTTILKQTGQFVSAVVTKAECNSAGAITITISQAVVPPFVVGTDALVVAWQVIALSSPSPQGLYNALVSPSPPLVPDFSAGGTGGTLTLLSQLADVIVPECVTATRAPIGAVDYFVVRLNTLGVTAPTTTGNPTAITAVLGDGTCRYAYALLPPLLVADSPIDTHTFLPFGTTFPNGTYYEWELDPTSVKPLPDGCALSVSVGQRLAPPDNTQTASCSLCPLQSYGTLGTRRTALFPSVASFHAGILAGAQGSKITASASTNSSPPTGVNVLYRYSPVPAGPPWQIYLVKEFIGGVRLTFYPVIHPNLASLQPLVFYDWDYNFMVGDASLDINGDKTWAFPQFSGSPLNVSSTWAVKIEVTSSPRLSGLSNPSFATQTFNEAEAIANARWRSAVQVPLVIDFNPPPPAP